MTICYIVDYDPNINSSVIQKVLLQVSNWLKNGHNVYIVSTKTMGIFDHNKNEIFKIKLPKFKKGKFYTALRLFFASFYLEKLLKNIKFDIIYMRYTLYMPFGSLKKYHVVMEINGDDILEYKLISNLKYFYNKLTRNLILKNADAFVCVSNELKEKFSSFQKPICVIANGIDTGNFSVLETKNKIPTLVFIGTPNQPWHGLDKIVEMSKKMQNFMFYVIGFNHESSENLKFLGYLNKVDSTKIIQQCDIGISTLSLYKEGLNEASPLKSRQYLACGLPIIYAYKDTDLKDNNEISLRLENSVDNIDYEKIQNFINSVFLNHEIRLKARKFACEVLDVSIKEKKRLEFFEKIIENLR